MAILLQIDRLTKSYGDRLLFGDISLGVNEGDKIGLIAKNGAGKSTLLKILCGEEDYDSGKITFRNDLRVSLLPQMPVFEPEQTPRGYIDGFPGDKDVKTALLSLITQISDNLDLDERFGNLSGGQKKRIALAGALASNPELLILDEPTNHLDIKTVEWLENYLMRSRVTLVMVTHDRYFLERVCNSIVEIDRQQIFVYPGNYKKYLEMRQNRIQAMGAELSKVKNILRREQEWMSRQPQARAGKSKSRIDRFYDLKQRSKVNLEEKNVRIEAKSTYIGNKIFHAENVGKSYGEKCVLKDFTYDFARYEKIGIVGDNGVGKSTFVKMLQGLVSPDTGFFDIGETVSFGYYSQDRAVFDPNKKVIDVVSDIADDINVGGGSLSPLQYLQHFLFDAKDQQKYISTLSGGELSRLYLATVLMRRPNFLILDEPTNDLDIVTLGLLEEYLSDYQGCVIVVSHDRFFLDNIVDHLFAMEGNGVVRDFPGNYSEYRQSAKEESATTAANRPAPNAGVKPRTERKEKLTYKERLEFESLTGELERINGRIARLEEIFNTAPDGEDIASCAAEYQQLKDDLDEKEMRWLELSEKQ